MDVVTLSAQSRAPGKKGARALRRDGNVPCVLYGRGLETVAFQIEEKSLGSLIYSAETHLVKIQVEDDEWECIVKDIAFHPVTDRPLHADFQVLSQHSKVTLTVPIRYLGTPVGQAHGGKISVVINDVAVSCLPRHIPSQIDVDTTQVEIGQSIHIGDLDFEHLEFLAPADQILMAIERPRMEVEEETEESTVDEEEE